MAIRDDKREAAIEAMADHILDVGLNAASLRSLAAAAGASDRMLLYYFKDKDEILAATLQRLAARLTRLLDAGLPQGGATAATQLLPTIWGVVGDRGLRPYMLVFLELAGAAARGQQPQGAIAAAIADGFLGWIQARLPGGDRAEAVRLLAMVEGLLMLDALGRRDFAEAAALGRTPSG